MKAAQGRFRGLLDPGALRFSSSLNVDRRLFEEDIEGSLAHVAMLANQGIVPAREAARIRSALRRIRRDVAAGKVLLTTEKAGGKRLAAEDVHMAIEQLVIEKVGRAGGLLHTARSRNDQVALDERLYLRKAIRRIISAIRLLQRQFVAKAARYRDVVMPGYTHLQRGQPVLLAHHLLAYVSMLQRDGGRFRDCLQRVNSSPLGAGALAGTSFPIDRNRVARALGFDGVVENSIDAVSDRDLLLEFIGACAVTMMHLSRFAEELVLWSSQEWRFAEIGDAFSTGSSIMPQKKNPDVAELIRGKTGRVYGDLMGLLTVMKGLPLAYNRDMQEDKEPMFDAADTVTSCLVIMARMLKTVAFKGTRFEKELDADFLLSTELADYLARKGLPFRKAHEIVGDIVRESSAEGVTLREISLDEYQRYSPLFQADVFRVLSARASISLKRSLGSTSPKEVAKALRSWKRKL